MKTKLERVRKVSNSVLEDIIKDHMENKSDHNELDLLVAFLKPQRIDELKIPITHNNIKAVI